MNSRIKRLSELTLNGEMYVYPIKTEYKDNENEVERLCKYILNQEPKITVDSLFTGMFNFDGSVIGDAFNRSGHKHNKEALEKHYLKKIDNISTFEWQHATGDYTRILQKGLVGIIEDIDKSISVHTKDSDLDFLNGLKKVASTLILWAEKCSNIVKDFSLTATDSKSRKNLERLSGTLKRVPKYAPENFYEAVLCIYICFSANPDSVGTLDRYLCTFYDKDIKDGIITRDEAKEYLQELFLMLQAATHVRSANFTRGGQSHFCVGGYLADKSDGFCDLSYLIVESLMELPTYIPQVTLRWTSKTPRDVLRYMMDCERKDAHKRIAFTNDDKRIKCYTELCGIPYERAVSYTTVGCNEPAFTGAIAGSTSKGNLLHSIETLFHKEYDKIKNVTTFEEFYGIYEKILFSELETILKYDDYYNSLRAKDINYISSLFACDCIENAKSITQGGCNYAIASPMLMGLVNCIDSLIVIKEWVFDKKILSLNQLTDALHNNWRGYENIRTLILKKTDFFGNDGEISNEIASLFYSSLYNFMKGKKNIYGYQWLVGDLAGYNEHYKWYGDDTKATPDGRFHGEMMKFGLGQNEGRDRKGLTALLNSVAKADKDLIGCGSTVTNISLDKAVVDDDEQFEKLVDTFESYFKNGGIHFQLTYVSKDDLIKAQSTPDKYKHLRVRVSGYSEYFVNLRMSIQNDIIKRTDK